MFLPLFLPLTLIAFLTLIALFPHAYKKHRRGLFLALGLGALTLVTGSWGILQSRSSTAVISFLFLPGYAVFATVMGVLFAQLKPSSNLVWRIVGWICLATALSVPVFLVHQGFGTLAFNQERDAKNAAIREEMERNRQVIQEALDQNPGRENDIVEKLIVDHATDRNFLLPLLGTPFVSPETLDRLADVPELTLASIRNPHCRSETLERVYRAHLLPLYSFLDTLAAHENTPPEILSELYHQRPAIISGLDRWLAKNPSVPKEILQEIAATTTESFVVQQLLQNPKFNCTLLEPLEAALGRSENPRDDYSLRRIRELHAGPCAGP